MSGNARNSLSIRRRQCAAFTLVELLVVISIIALLISILLPSLKRARHQAKAAHCGVLQRGFATGLSTYVTEEMDWIPSRNTTGVEIWERALDTILPPQKAEAMHQPHVPVQTYDWMTPLLRLETQLPHDRARRFYTLFDEYRCAEVNFKAVLYTSGFLPIDDNRFVSVIDEKGAYPGTSYLMPTYFQLWGEEDARNVTLLRYDGFPLSFRAKAPASFWTVQMKHYKSRIDHVGTPAEKIAAADGTRYLPQTPLPLDFDHHYDPELRSASGRGWFGAFTSGGAYWVGSTAYGGIQSPSRGKNVPLSYRHNDGLQAVFFDGHVEWISRKQSRKVDYWYPRGSSIKYGNGFRDYHWYDVGYVIR